MLTYIIGECEAGKNGDLLVQCGPIGFSLSCSAIALSRFSSAKGAQKVFTRLTLSESGAVLYGFWDEAERDMFERLVSVSKVGPKAALGILSRYPPSQLAGILSAGDAKALSQASGVGKKLAESIIFNLRSQFGENSALQLRMEEEGMGLDMNEPKTAALLALESLGFEAAQAQGMVKAAYREGISAEELIRSALQS
ncbi:MAG: Holliday junction branch migration protein RuvA [Eubacteriaceae bacterium]|jgi:Holliday junction DNA helicase RuvA|nr:Holliday junction branch migration protein RuvA [Eubacteriaceae bacterium]